MKPKIKRLFLSFSLLAFSLLATFVFLPISCSRSGQTEGYRGSGGRGRSRSSISPPLGLRWTLPLNKEKEAAKFFNTPIIKKNTLYFGSSDGNFYAFNLQSGYLRWAFQTKGTINSVPTSDDKAVYFGSNDGFVYALSLKTGKKIWSFQSGYDNNSTFVLYQNNLVFISDRGAVQILDKETGKELFSYPNLIWSHNAFQIYRGVLYFSPGPLESPRNIGVFDLKTKEHLWSLDLRGSPSTWYSFPALDGNRLFFSSADEGKTINHNNYIFYALDRRTGYPLWQRSDRIRISGNPDMSLRELQYQNFELLDYLAPAVWRNSVIYAAGDNIIRAFKKQNGKSLWEKSMTAPTSSAPVVAGNRLYLGLRGNSALNSPPQLVSLSAKNGKLLWSFPVQGHILGAPVIKGRWITFGTSENRLYVLEQVF